MSMKRIIAVGLIYALACAVTTILRWLQGWRAFTDPAKLS